MVYKLPPEYHSFSEKTEMQFYSVFKKLWPLGCSYFSYSLEKEGIFRLHFFSDKIWANVFVEEKLIDSCPLTFFCRNSMRGSLFWSDLPTLSKEKHIVMAARKDYHLNDGLTILSKLGNVREMVAFATNNEDLYFKKNVINNFNLIKEATNLFRATALESHVFTKSI
jgi:hypothetical protein